MQSLRVFQKPKHTGKTDHRHSSRWNDLGVGFTARWPLGKIVELRCASSPGYHVAHGRTICPKTRRDTVKLRNYGPNLEPDISFLYRVRSSLHIKLEMFASTLAK